MSHLGKCDACSLIRAQNNTTRFQYFWCPMHQLVHKDTDFDGFIRGKCVVCLDDITHKRAGTKTCGAACRKMLSRLTSVD